MIGKNHSQTNRPNGQKEKCMRMFIETIVHSVAVATEPKDLEKGLGFILVLQVSKKIGDVVVPDYIKTKSKIRIDPSPDNQLLEVEVFNIAGQGGGQFGGKVQTYYRIIRKAEFGGKK